MMTSRERVSRTLKHKPVDCVPRHLWTLPGVGMFRKDEMNLINTAFPSDIISPDVKFGVSRRASGKPNLPGIYTDAWGSIWHVAEPGVIGEVKEYAIPELEDVSHYELPWELLDRADFTKVDASCAATDCFVLAGTWTRPFERMQFLRGTENLFIDLANDEPEIWHLRDSLHEFSLREMNLWAQTAVDGVSFMDDLGSQKSLLISPEIWRAFYKPLYKEYCDILHAAGKAVFFHSDGHIEAIYPDLVEIGIDAVNSQLFCMDIERLAANFGDNITFWGEIDRQFILPFGTTDDVRNAVDRVATATIGKRGRTGIIAECEWGLHDPYENIKAVFDQWNRW